MQIAAAIIFVVCITLVVLFQLALAFGAPWGEYSMGGKFQGKYPPAMRVVAGLNAAVLVCVALVVLSGAGALLPSWESFASWAMWVLVVLFAVGFVLNVITKSTWERRIWAPVAFVLFVMSLVIAIL